MFREYEQPAAIICVAVILVIVARALGVKWKPRRTTPLNGEQWMLGLLLSAQAIGYLEIALSSDMASWLVLVASGVIVFGIVLVDQHGDIWQVETLYRLETVETGMLAIAASTILLMSVGFNDSEEVFEWGTILFLPSAALALIIRLMDKSRRGIS